MNLSESPLSPLHLVFVILTVSCFILLYFTFLNERKIIKNTQVNSRCIHNLSPNVPRSSKISSKHLIVPQKIRPKCMNEWTKLGLPEVELNLKKSGFHKVRFKVINQIRFC